MKLTSQKGISLVDVLITIAIIAVLLGILIPVLTKARAASRQSVCVSNLKQLGNAFAAYANDWSDTYPSPGGLAGDYNYWAQTGRGGLVSYIGRNGGLGTVWCCPEQTTWNCVYPARTYSMNSYLRNPPDVGYPTCVGIFGGCRSSMIELRNKTILLYEGVPVPGNWGYASNAPYCNYVYRCGGWEQVKGWIATDKPWHGRTSNYLYTDGHVKAHVPEKYPNYPKFDLNNEWYVQKSVQAAKYKGY